jgi:hypothetical protein
MPFSVYWYHCSLTTRSIVHSQLLLQRMCTFVHFRHAQWQSTIVIQTCQLDIFRCVLYNIMFPVSYSHSQVSSPPDSTTHYAIVKEIFLPCFSSQYSSCSARHAMCLFPCQHGLASIVSLVSTSLSRMQCSAALMLLWILICSTPLLPLISCRHLLP